MGTDSGTLIRSRFYLKIDYYCVDFLLKIHMQVLFKYMLFEYELLKNLAN